MAASTLYIILLSDKAFIYFSKLSLVECARHAVPSGEACFSLRRPAAPAGRPPPGVRVGGCRMASLMSAGTLLTRMSYSLNQSRCIYILRG